MVATDSVLEKASSLKAAGKPFALVTVVRCESPTSAKPGAKAIVTPDGQIEGWIGGGCAQPAVIKTAKQALHDGQPRLIRISPERNEPVEAGIVDFGMTCHSGGTLDIFIDPVVPRPALLVLGVSPTAQALCMLAARVGFSVTTAFKEATQELFPDADTVLTTLDIGALTAIRPTYVVVATQGKRDEDALEAALATEAPYIAFVASEKKAQKLRQYLKERGHAPKRVDTLVSPAGVEIGAVTPEEIALSVLAGVVAARRAGAALMTQPSATEHANAHKAAAVQIAGGARASSKESGARPIDPICGMTVDPASAEHTSQHGGKTFYFCGAHCQHKFDQSPEKYAMQAVGAT